MHPSAVLGLSVWTTLAQNPFAIPSPQPLPGAPVWETYLLERPWPLGLALAIIAIVVVLKGRGRWRAAIALAAALAAAGVFVASAQVTTARERILASTHALVEAVVKADISALDSQLDPNAKLFSWQHPSGVGKDEILAQVERGFHSGGAMAIKEYDILNLDASRDGQRVGRSLVKVRATSAAMGIPVFSWWLLDYRLDDAGTWRVIRLEPQAISSVPDSRARR